VVSGSAGDEPGDQVIDFTIRVGMLHGLYGPRCAARVIPLNFGDSRLSCSIIFGTVFE
jgi:hypothetical protein